MTGQVLPRVARPACTGYHIHMTSTELLTDRQAARLAHVSRATIVYWSKTERLAYTHKTVTVNGRPWGKLYRPEDVLAACPSNRERTLKEANPGLMTVPELASALGIRPNLAYKVAKTFELKKYFVDGVQYLVDSQEFHEKRLDAIPSAGSF